MEKEKTMFNIFSVNDKDAVRMYEQHHESKLKKRLLSLGFLVEFEFDKIAHHGIRNIGE